MSGTDDGIDLSWFQENSAWTVTNPRWERDVEDSDATIIFFITLKRKPLFFILFIIVPYCMLAVLNICVFLLPCDSGEKSGYAMTVFLSFAVFLTIVATLLPQNSEKIAILSVFLFIQMIASTLITIIALGMRRVSQFPEDKPVPSWIVNLLKCNTCRKKINPTVMVLSVNTIENPVDLEKDVTHPDNSAKDFKLTWNDVVNFFDLVFFIIFSLVLILSAIICFTIAATKKPI